MLRPTVKQLSNLPHKEFPENYPLYVPREDLVQYYEDDADNNHRWSILMWHTDCYDRENDEQIFIIEN